MLLRPLYWVIGLSVLAVSASLGYTHLQTQDLDGYAGSPSCQACHQGHYQNWKKTLHSKMFRPVKSPEDIQGDFSTPNPLVTFDKSEIKFVVGNKWEQVYARKLDGEYYPLPAKWMITTQKWVSMKLTSEKDTPMSKTCNGCHTTGFDPSTFEFSEFGIGCEACHGPGKKHAVNQQKVSSKACILCHRGSAGPLSIIRSVDSTVCGQCHSRGHSARKQPEKVNFRFPLNYQPGQPLPKNFVPLAPKQDLKRKFWWGNGVAKNRHQEYADWQNSGHSKALTNLLTKTDHSRGEKQDSCLVCHSADYRSAKGSNKPTLHTAKQGITCVVCHEPHGAGSKVDALPKGTAGCGGCHIDSMASKERKTGKSHYPCPNGAPTCVGCHMPVIVKTGGTFTLHSHAFSILSPTKAKEQGSPSSCQNGGCHLDKPVEWAIQAYTDFYGNKP